MDEVWSAGFTEIGVDEDFDIDPSRLLDVIGDLVVDVEVLDEVVDLLVASGPASVCTSKLPQVDCDNRTVLVLARSRALRGLCPAPENPPGHDRYDHLLSMTNLQGRLLRQQTRHGQCSPC